MAKNSPIETRTNRMAYCSKSLLPCSANWTNHFQSISCPPTVPDNHAANRNGGSLANSRASKLCVHPFDPLSTRCGSHEWIRKVLCFSPNLVAPELHDAHGVGRLAVIGQDVFGDPKITAANNSPDRKPLFVRLTRALTLYVASTAGSLAGLRVFQHRVLAIDEVLGFKIAGVGRGPTLIQRRTDLSISVSIVHPKPPI